MRIDHDKKGKPVYWSRCQLCGSEYRCGPSIYKGRIIHRYQLEVCQTCDLTNPDGWGPHVEAAFVAHLESKGIPLPERNERGWYPRE